MRRDKAVKYFRLAQTLAELFSKDPSTKVGAILLAPGSLQVLSLGYNGMPRRIDEAVAARWERPAKYRYVEHAERNALFNACRHGTPVEGSVAVITLFPCCDCARALIQSGVAEVVAPAPDMADARWGADFAVAMEMFVESGTALVLLSAAEASGAPGACCAPPAGA